MFVVSVPTLSVQPDCYLSELVRYMLAEKGAECRLIDISDATGQALAQKKFNRLCAPALSDHGIAMDELDVIIEYIEERYPHPVLLPVNPADRATFRVFFRRVLRDFYPLMQRAEQQSCTTSSEAIRAEISSLAPVFAAKPFFMSDEIGLLDIAFAPIVRRLHRCQANLGAPINKYISRMVRRPAFQQAIP